MKCSFCGLEDEGKFCSGCGRSLATDSLSVDGNQKIKLGFGKSTSANYSYILELIQRQTTYSTESDNSLHTALFDTNSIDEFFEIFDSVKTWKTSFIEINGKKIPMSKIRNGLSCFQDRLKSYDIEKHCFGWDAAHFNFYDTNPLGCRLCGVNNSYWKGWYTIGNLSKAGIFTVDKSRIRHIVNKSVDEIGYCPVLDRDAILKQIDTLPDKINPKKDSDFEYTTSWEKDKSVATGVRIKEKKSGFVVEDYSEAVEQTTVAEQKDKSGSSGCGCGAVGVLVFTVLLVLVLSSIL